MSGLGGAVAGAVAGGGGFDQKFVRETLSPPSASIAPNSFDITPSGDQSVQVAKAQALARRTIAARNNPSAGAPSNSQQEQQGYSASPVAESVQSNAARSAPKAEEVKAEGAATDNSPVSVRLQQPQGINTVERNELIRKTGREFGPDIALKVAPKIVDKENVGDESKDIINSKSSITEVLNILAFLLNNDDERKRSVITDFSYGNDDKFNAVYASLKDKVPFDIKTLTLTSSAAGVEGTETKPTVSITIPNTILKRNESYALKEPITIESKDIQPLITACILQMVNILENTRQVFGGWAKLFKGMQGGSNSKSKTKTRRNNRRRH
jgi:hypothetical protein